MLSWNWHTKKLKMFMEKLLILNDYTVIGSDTIVVYRDEILGKPVDKQEAYDMLSMLADRTHQVYTGVSLIQKKQW